MLPDFRAPANIRFGIAPIYNSFGEIHAAVLRMRQIVLEGRHEKYMAEEPTVT